MRFLELFKVMQQGCASNIVYVSGNSTYYSLAALTLQKRFSILIILRPTRGGGTQLFWCVCHTGSKVGSIGSGFSLKNEGSWERKFGKFAREICVLRAGILVKTRMKMHNFSTN